MKDKYPFNLQGFFKIYDLSNKKQILYESNLVVTKARYILRDLMFEANEDIIISKIKFGDKGCSEEDNILPIPPMLTDIGLNANENIYEKVVNKSILDANKIVYSVILEKDEANIGGSFSITEAGLFNNRGEMFARKTFPVVSKTQDRAYEFEWTILF